MNNANFFKTTSQQDVTHVPAGNNVKAVSSWYHNLGAMTKQTSGKTGHKRNDNIDLFNIDPTGLIDDNARQHKKPKVTSKGNSIKPDAIEIGVSLETQMKDEIIFEPSLCYPYIQNIPHIVDLQSKHNTLGTYTMISNNEDMTLSVSTQGLHLIVQNIIKEKYFASSNSLTKESMAATAQNQIQSAAC